MKKRLLSILLMCCMVLTLLPTAVFAEGETDVSINETNFPDANFRTVVKEYDTDKDENLSRVEIEAVKEIKCYHKDIRSLTGIEYFTALQTLKCYSNQLTSLDISGNTALKSLDCAKNQLAALDVSQNTALESLDCADNQLTTLDVSRNTALESLDCAKNQLTTLDVSQNTALESLNCADNQVTSLDISQNTALESLICASNKLTALNVSGNATLKFLNCESNELTALDVNRNTALNTLNCRNNRLTSLNVSLNLNLQDLNCSTNQLSALDVQKNTALKSLYCGYNQLTVLDVGQNRSLESLSCNNNLLTTLDVSQNTRLNLLLCFNNHLTSLDTSNQKRLHTLSCNNNNYPITITNDRNYDLSDLPGTFDVNKASNWSGGTVSGNILTVDHDKDSVTYTYDCGNGKTANFTLTVEEGVEEQFTLTPGGRYYFDLSAMDIPGTVNSNLPDSTLHYVPFTYVGTVDAYKRTGVSDKNTDAYEHSLFIADYAVTHTVSWNDLNTQGMIFGKAYTSGGIDYTLRAPSVGRDYKGSAETKRGAPINNEWDTILDKAKQDHLDNTGGYIKNWKDIYSFGQEGYLDAKGYPAVRGYTSAFFYTYTGASNTEAAFGYRPVLELPTGLAADSLKVVTLNTDGHMPGETYNSINIIVKKGESFTAPSAEGLPVSDDIPAGTPMCWVDENINIYKPGDTVPADVSVLYAFYGGFGLFLDRGDVAVEVTPDNYTDIFGDGTASFVLPKGRTYDDIFESDSLTESDRLEILATGRYGENIFPNLKLKNADLTSVTLSDSYIGQGSPFFITLVGKNTIGSLNRTGRALSALSILGDGTLTLHAALRLSIYAQYGGSSVTVTDGLNIANALCIDSGSLTVTGDPQAVTLPDSSRIALYMDDALRLFLGSSAQDAVEAALPQLSAEMQALYERYLARDPSFTQDELDALENALAKQWADTLALFSGKTYVRIANAWDVTYLPGADGTGDAVTDIKFYREDLALRRTPFTRIGCTQTGWSKVDGGEKDYNLGGIYTEDAALTLYPVWNANQYTITFDTDGGTPVDSITQDYGTAIIAPANPSKPGYTFTGWNPELPATMPAENLTVTAQWSPDIYAITYNLDGGTASGNPDFYTVESSTITLNPPTRTGYTFIGWSGTDLSGSDNLTVTIPTGSIGNRSYTAHWSLNTYSITYDLDGGTALGNPDFYTVESSAITLNEPTKAGYVFTGWSGTDLVGEDNLTVTIPAGSIGDRRYTAHWEFDPTIIAALNPTPNVDFLDVSRTDWFYYDVRYVCENGLMNGTSRNRFSPYGTATRGMLVTILYRMENEPRCFGSAAFSDVKPGAYYEKAVVWASQNNIVSGYTDGTFRPDAPVTREQLASILYRYTRYRGQDVSAAGTTSLTGYGDAQAVSNYALPAMRWACSMGILQGANGKLNPNGLATRAQLAAMLHRYLTK